MAPSGGGPHASFTAQVRLGTFAFQYVNQKPLVLKAVLALKDVEHAVRLELYVLFGRNHEARN